MKGVLVCVPLLGLAVNFVALGAGKGQPPAWVTYSPLLPLALLLFSGLYMFALPYATKWRSGRRTDNARVHDERTAASASE